MSAEIDEIMDIVKETKSILDDFVKLFANIERRLEKIENQIY